MILSLLIIAILLLWVLTLFIENSHLRRRLRESLKDLDQARKIGNE